MRASGGIAPASIAVGVALGLVVSLFGLSGNWTPFEHTVCNTGSILSNEPDRFFPSVFANSPYGGSADGQSGASGVIVDNGTAGAVFQERVNASLYSAHNSSSWGPGVNDPCEGPMALVLQVDIIGAGTVLVPTVSNLTDAGEATNVSAGDTPLNLSTLAFFNNSFTGANAATISTCGGGALELPDQTAHLKVGIPFDVHGQTVVVPYELHALETFSYTFPANFGTWAVDNLSEPGGPGGGWAFDYLGPCL